MINKVYRFINDNDLIKSNEHVVIGLSGGADSICLVHLLNNLKSKINFTISCVHIHHGLRGNDADKDVQFVIKFTKQYGIPCEVFYYNIKEVANRMKLSEEEAGRLIRYKKMNKVLKKYNNAKIAVAHHKNDQAETVLFNLFRGTGLKGLLGMQPIRNNIIRPLLCLTRLEIETYLQKNNITYRDDYTNYETHFSRNKIRLKIIPYIKKEINAKIIENINRTAQILTIEEDFLRQYSKKIYNKIAVYNESQIIISINQLLNLHQAIKVRIIRMAITNLIKHVNNIEQQHIELICKLMNKPVGKHINLPNNIKVTKDYESLKFEVESIKITKKLFRNIIIKPNETYEIPELNKTLITEIFELEEVIIPKKIYTKWFDYDKIKSTLILRTRQIGDYFAINGIAGNKKLKDYYIDEKIPREDRDYIPLLADGHHILWIIGYRISEAYKITQTTKKVLSITVIDRRQKCNLK